MVTREGPQMAVAGIDFRPMDKKNPHSEGV